MRITVQRVTYTNESVQGKMSLDGEFECYTLEPPRKPPGQPKPFCVPAGVYRYRVGPSNHFGRNVVFVDNIPGFDDVEVHPGNFPTDTHGCCLVGKTEGPNFVGHSDEEFDALLEKLPPVGQIEYEDFLESHPTL